jgi:hypothetical protein
VSIDGVSKYFLVYHQRSAMHFDGCKTLVDVVERATRMHVSLGGGDQWMALREMEAAVAKVKAGMMADERRDAAYEIRGELADALWSELHASWIDAAMQPRMLSGGESRTSPHHVPLPRKRSTRYRIDLAGAPIGRLASALEEKDLLDTLDEQASAVLDSLHERLADALWERDVVLDWEVQE